MKKKSIIAICAVLVILILAAVLVLTGNRGNVSNVNRVVGYSALYGENSINEAFDVIEKKFAKDFEGCTLTELRYDKDVENRFAEEIEKYHKENNQLGVLITYQRDSASSTPQVLLSNFLPVQHILCTDPNTAFHSNHKKSCSGDTAAFSLTSTILLTLLLLLSYQRDLLSRIILHVLLYPDELLLLSQRSENVTAMFFLRRHR